MPKTTRNQDNNSRVPKAYLQAKLRGASEILESAFQPGLGNSMQRIRINKALFVLHELESQIISEKDLYHVRRRLLDARHLCEKVMNRDVPDILYHAGEVIHTWVWLSTRSTRDHSTYATQIRQVLGDILSASYMENTDLQALMYGLEERLLKVFGRPFMFIVQLEVSSTLLKDIFHQAVVHFEGGRWAQAMSLLNSQKYLERSGAEVLGDYSFTYEYQPGDVKTLRTEFTTQLAVCRGAQLIHLGDLHFREAEIGEPEDFLARALLAQDDYRVALSTVTDQDIELEGATLYRLARFHSKVSKLPTVAHQLYLRAVQLGTALSPALPKGVWYRESVDAVQAYRDKLQAEEAKKWANRRLPILEKLSKEMDMLKGAKEMDNLKFAEFIFRTWPPKTEGPKTPTSDSTTLTKKQLLKVIQRYHTDKNPRFGDEWLVLCEEISKALVGRYNTLKGAD